MYNIVRYYYTYIHVHTKDLCIDYYLTFTLGMAFSTFAQYSMPTNNIVSGRITTNPAKALPKPMKKLIEFSMLLPSPIHN